MTLDQVLDILLRGQVALHPDDITVPDSVDFVDRAGESLLLLTVHDNVRALAG